MKNEFVENRAARQMQTMARAGRFAKKLLEKSKASSQEDKYRARASGRTTGFAEQNTEFPLLSNWEISTYTIMWNTTTKETGGTPPHPSNGCSVALLQCHPVNPHADPTLTTHPTPTPTPSPTPTPTPTPSP